VRYGEKEFCYNTYAVLGESVYGMACIDFGSKTLNYHLLHLLLSLYLFVEILLSDNPFGAAVNHSKNKCVCLPPNDLS
jgi:hypothetical protein